ncbi:MAG: hypothetical protein M1546_23650, partial [Chloroflexi bacterium]|nr:hypothetical protein [Chloroflexota bacterium]
TRQPRERQEPALTLPASAFLHLSLSAKAMDDRISEPIRLPSQTPDTLFLCATLRLSATLRLKPM